MTTLDFDLLLGHPVLSVNIYTTAKNKSLNNAFNNKMANNLINASIYMQRWAKYSHLSIWNTKIQILEK